MRNLFEQPKQRIAAHTEQRDDLTLVVRCKNEEIAIVLKLIEGAEETSQHTFLDHTEDFVEAQLYVSTLVTKMLGLSQQVGALREKEGGPPIPPAPERMRDDRVPAPERLRELMCWARSMIEDPQAALVWIMMPIQIHDAVGYANLMTQTLRHSYPRPWCHNMRVIVRDDERLPLEHSKAAFNRAQFMAVDFGSKSTEDALVESANDESLPLRERMTSLLVLAGIDAAHNRTADAKEKYKLLAKYHHALGDNAQWALSLMGLADVAAREGKPRDAKDLYLAALTPATHAKSFPVVLNCALALGNLHFQNGVWVEAATWYHTAGEMARALLNPDTLLDCYEHEGLSYHKAGAHKQALEAWNNGIELAKNIPIRDRQKRLITRKLDMYTELGLQKERDKTQLELQAVDQLAKQEAQPKVEA
jgi:tetratricopeptide (TPR) repeat protein